MLGSVLTLVQLAGAAALLLVVIEGTTAHDTASLRPGTSSVDVPGVAQSGSTGMGAEGPRPPVFAVAQDDTGAPVAWPRCQPIRWGYSVTDPDDAETLRHAVRKTASATGLQLEEVGPVSPMASPDAPIPTSAPDIVIAVVSRQEGDFPRNAVGTTVRWRVSTGGIPELVRADIRLDAAFVRERPEYLMALALHELGHAVGLDHVDERSEVMYPVLAHPATDFGAGDRAGLTLLGPHNGECAGGR